MPQRCSKTRWPCFCALVGDLSAPVCCARAAIGKIPRKTSKAHREYFMEGSPGQTLPRSDLPARGTLSGELNRQPGPCGANREQIRNNRQVRILVRSSKGPRASALRATQRSRRRIEAIGEGMFIAVGVPSSLCHARLSCDFSPARAQLLHGAQKWTGANSLQWNASAKDTMAHGVPVSMVSRAWSVFAGM